MSCAHYLQIIPAENPTAVRRNSSLKKGINSMIWAVGLALYFIISFATNAWYVTWVIFLIAAAARGLVKAILDLMEANSNEA